MNTESIKKIFKNIPWERLTVRLVASVLIMDSIFLFMTKTGFDVVFYPLAFPLPMVLVYMSAAFLSLSALKVIFKDFPSDEWALLASGLVYAVLTLWRKNNFFFSLGIMLGLMLIFWYLSRDDKLRLSGFKISKRLLLTLVFVLGISFAVFVGVTTSFRYLSYRSPNYDFGIFSQMFYSMRDTGLPMVSSERDKILSHFAVHISPIFYLLLPGFMIFPSPVYLEASQALLLASGLIPLYLICREKKLGNIETLVLSFCYIALPALAGGCYYDLHENKFLTPLILWLFYFIEKDKTLWIFVFSVLTLLVKEDAAIYVACIALYIFFGKKKYAKGGALFLCSILYFLGAVFILSHYGDGVMTYRYDNFMSDPEAGLIGIIKTILVNPAYLFSECFTSQKLEFMLLMLLPFGLLPVMNKKFSQFLLLIPMILINLMSDYQYQYSIYFQYTYGTTALLTYLAAVNLSELKSANKKMLLAFMTSATLVFSVPRIPMKLEYIPYYNKNAETISELNETLSGIPKEASVKSSAFLIPHLADRTNLFSIESKHETDFVIFDDRPDYVEETRKDLESKYLSEGYEIYEYRPGVILILSK